MGGINGGKRGITGVWPPSARTKSRFQGGMITYPRMVRIGRATVSRKPFWMSVKPPKAEVAGEVPLSSFRACVEISGDYKDKERIFAASGDKPLFPRQFVRMGLS